MTQWLIISCNCKEKAPIKTSQDPSQCSALLVSRRSNKTRKVKICADQALGSWSLSLTAHKATSPKRSQLPALLTCCQGCCPVPWTTFSNEQHWVSRCAAKTQQHCSNTLHSFMNSVSTWSNVSWRMQLGILMLLLLRTIHPADYCRQ